MRKRQKTTRNNNDTTSSDINEEPKANDVSKSSTNTTTSEEQDKDKIERMRLKKAQKKSMQKEKKMALKQEEARQQSKRQAEKAVHDKQKKDLEKKKKNLKKETGSQEYKTLAKGVKYQDLVIGKGMPVQHRKKVRVSYTLRAKSHTSGKIIDSSRNFGFRIGKGEVIKGWDIGLEGMRVGGSRRLIVPPGAGYGHNKDVGAGKGGELYFQIELLHVAP